MAWRSFSPPSSYWPCCRRSDSASQMQHAAASRAAPAPAISPGPGPRLRRPRCAGKLEDDVLHAVRLEGRAFLPAGAADGLQHQSRKADPGARPLALGKAPAAGVPRNPQCPTQRAISTAPRWAKCRWQKSDTGITGSSAAHRGCPGQQQRVGGRRRSSSFRSTPAASRAGCAARQPGHQPAHIEGRGLSRRSGDARNSARLRLSGPVPAAAEIPVVELRAFAQSLSIVVAGVQLPGGPRQASFQRRGQRRARAMPAARRGCPAAISFGARLYRE